MRPPDPRRAQRDHRRLGQELAHLLELLPGAGEADHRALAQALHASPAAVLLSGYPSALYEELYGGWWRLERTVQRPTSNVSGGRGAVATEVVWSNRPLAHQGRLGESEAVVGP